MKSDSAVSFSDSGLFLSIRCVVATARVMILEGEKADGDFRTGLDGVGFCNLVCQVKTCSHGNADGA